MKASQRQLRVIVWVFSPALNAFAGSPLFFDVGYLAGCGIGIATQIMGGVETL